MENKKESARVSCKYKDPNTFVMTCEEEETAQKVPTVEEPAVAQSAHETTVVEQADTEEIEVPIVGDTNETDESYVEPLGESTSWYPDSVNYDNVINYSYGKSSDFVASLTNPEVGFEVSDIFLVAIIALSCLAVVSSITFLTGRAINNNRASRKDFIKK